MPRGLELERQAIEVLLPIFRPLAVARLFVVARPSGEVGRQRVLGPWDRAVADPVAIHIAVRLEPAEPFEVGRAEQLAAIDRLFGIGEWVGQPEVHPHVEVGRHENGGLELLGEVERLGGEG